MGKTELEGELARPDIEDTLVRGALEFGERVREGLDAMTENNAASS